MPFSIIQSNSANCAGESSKIHLHEGEVLNEPGPGEVLVKFLAAPIHPLDALVVEDRYPVRPKYQADGQGILGYDGVGQIVKCGPNLDPACNLGLGDLVIPFEFGLGTWREYGIIQDHFLQRVSVHPKDIVMASLLQLSVAPAYCLVEDMHALKPGDYIIQNAGTSSISQFVTQFASLRGVHTIHIIRDRPSFQVELVRKDLVAHGADLVLTESELSSELLQLRKTRRIVLALDAVFGNSGTHIMQALRDGGRYVQMGFLGGQDGTVHLDSKDLFARRITMQGFRGSARMAARSREERESLCNWWIELFNRGILKLPALGIEKIPWRSGEGFDDVVRNIQRANKEEKGYRKQVIVFDEVKAIESHSGMSG